jgi:hypothetical protein
MQSEERAKIARKGGSIVELWMKKSISFGVWENCVIVLRIEEFSRQKV